MLSYILSFTSFNSFTPKSLLSLEATSCSGDLKVPVLSTQIRCGTVTVQGTCRPVSLFIRPKDLSKKQTGKEPV